MHDKNQLHTVGDIAKRLEIARHVVDYAVGRYNIEETQRAGILRLFDEDAVERIRRAVRRTHGCQEAAAALSADEGKRQKPAAGPQSKQLPLKPGHLCRGGEGGAA